MSIFFFNAKKKIASFCCLALFILAQLNVAAQSNSKYNDSLFAKFSATNAFTKTTTPYYICKWKEQPPATIKIIRQLTEQMAIVTIAEKDKQQLQQLQYAAANNNWKLSPAAEKKLNGTGIDNFIFTGLTFQSG